MSGKHTNVYDEKIRRAEQEALGYRAPNGTVPKTAAPPAKTKSLGEVVTEVKSFFSKPAKPAKKK